MFSILNELSMS